MASLKARSQFYYSLAVLLDAGLPPDSALEKCGTGGIRGVIRQMRNDTGSGMKLHEAMARTGFFSQMESNLIAVGEQTGTMPAMLRNLSEWFKLKHDIRSKFFSALAYPLFLYHFTGLAISIVNGFSPGGSLETSIIFFLIWSAAPWLCLVLTKLLPDCIVRKKIPAAIIDRIPFAGSLLFNLETAFFFRVLGTSLGAGGGAASSITIAADCCQTAFYTEHYKKAANAVNIYSCSITDALAMSMTSREYNSPLPGMIAAAEVSGTLPEACERISIMQMERVSGQLRRTAAAAQTIFYLGICTYAAYKIISFYSGYLSQINSLLEI